MILDLLSQHAPYTSIHPGFAAGFEFLRRPDLATLAAGRYAIDGERIYAIVQDYETKPWGEGFLEVHRRYTDIQYIVSGEEFIGYAPLEKQPVKERYDEATDIAFLYGPSDPTLMRSGMFAIFFPHDAHMPARTTSVPSAVRKVVVKTLVAFDAVQD